jgi:hypothetical protein
MKGTSPLRWTALLACPCMALAQHTEGFIGFRWGTPLQEIRQKLELTRVREEGRYELYELGDLPFEGIDLRGCGLEFVDGRLSGGFCQTRGVEDSRLLRLRLERQLGRPLSVRQYTAQWSGPDTCADYDEDATGNAYLYLYSRRLNEPVEPEH